MSLVSDSMEDTASCSTTTTTALVSTHNHERLDLKSIRAVVISVNRCVLKIIANAKTRNSIRVRCTSKLQNQKQDDFFEFSDQSVISNLYWGIDSIEAVINAKWPEEKAAQLRKAEQMLQVPALLDEDGVTAGIQNSYLVCCSYFYLAVIRKLEKDEWQVALHFLQAVLVSPRLVQTEFAHDLYDSLFPTCNDSEIQEKRARKDSDLIEKDEAIRQMARIYRDWLMYYKVMLYGETPKGQGGYRETVSPDKVSLYSLHGKSSSNYLKKYEHDHGQQTQQNFEKVYPFEPYGDIVIEDEQKLSIYVPGFQEYEFPSKDLDQATEFQRNLSTKKLQDMLDDSLSDTPTSVDSCSDYSANDTDSEVTDAGECSTRSVRPTTDFPKKLQPPSSTSNSGCKALSFPQACRDPMPKEALRESNSMIIASTFTNSINGLLSISEHRDKRSRTLQISYGEKESASNKRYHQRSGARRKQSVSSQKGSIELRLHSKKNSKSELLSMTEKAISKLFHWEGLGKWDEDYAEEVTTIYQILCNKKGEKCAVLKDMILDQLLIGISASKEDKVIRVSVSILTTIVAANKSVIDDIKKKGLQLSDLASALKRNVHEAAILFYLMNPSPTEIKTLELLPALVGVVCSPNSYKGRPASLPTPMTASLMIIGVLVSSFDHATNNVHLAEISYPKVLHGLLDVARDSNIEELITWATILVKCIQYDGQCRKYISRLAPLAPFSRLLESKMKHARCIALEFFHEVLCIPRSSATALLQRLQKEGSTNITNSLMLCIQQLQPEYQLLAANLLLLLDTLDSYSKSVFREEAMQVLLKLVASEESSTTHHLSAFILSNLGGTYSWTGEPYTVAWLVKKAGLTSSYQRNMIKNIHWLEECLEDVGIDSWCSKVSRSIINMGNYVFESLVKGLMGKTRKVSRDCLIAIAWLGFEISKSPDTIRCSACEILLSGVEQFLHPGLELEERVLACLCIYNYASGKGMKKFIHFSEGVIESLRRLSNVTWMAEELHKVADFVLPNRSITYSIMYRSHGIIIMTNQRISCVHTQILEVGVSNSGAVCALMYYKGFLHGGYSDGSVKVWNIKGQSASLVWDMKEHKKAVTCFSLLESRDSLISGSLDKTIRVWQVVHRKLECIEVIETKEPIQHLTTCGDTIVAITRSHGIKVFDASRKVREHCTNKKVKCITMVQGKIYAGCKDSSIQELSTTSNRAQEIKVAAKFWKLQRRPINAVVTYKDWLYSASSIVEGSNTKEWKRHGKPQMSLKTEKREKVLALGVTEDFLYLNCSSTTNSIQIWLRGTQQKVGRISAGSRITSLHTANDIILCGTEAGLIKGWIPL